jgi:hypothetical protein
LASPTPAERILTDLTGTSAAMKEVLFPAVSCSALCSAGHSQCASQSWLNCSCWTEAQVLHAEAARSLELIPSTSRLDGLEQQKRSATTGVALMPSCEATGAQLLRTARHQNIQADRRSIDVTEQVSSAGQCRLCYAIQAEQQMTGLYICRKEENGNKSKLHQETRELRVFAGVVASHCRGI